MILVGGALIAAALWILWMINAPLLDLLGKADTTKAAEAVEKCIAATVPEQGGQEEIRDAKSACEPAQWQLVWFTMFLILAVFVFGVGRALTGTWKSLLIDGRNKQSLSRLQLVLWTWLVTSSIAAALAWNIHIGADDPI